MMVSPTFIPFLACKCHSKYKMKIYIYILCVELLHSLVYVVSVVFVTTPSV